MKTGTVKWYSLVKGFGFIEPDVGGADVFVHVSAVQASGLGEIREGDRLSYEIESNSRTGKFQAVRLKKLN